jgi:hypothetical protein
MNVLKYSVCLEDTEGGYLIFILYFWYIERYEEGSRSLKTVRYAFLRALLEGKRMPV